MPEYLTGSLKLMERATVETGFYQCNGLGFINVINKINSHMHSFLCVIFQPNNSGEIGRMLHNFFLLVVQILRIARSRRSLKLI